MQAVAAQQAQLLASLNASGKLSEQVLKMSLVYWHKGTNTDADACAGGRGHAAGLHHGSRAH